MRNQSQPSADRNPNPLEIEVNRAMARAARRVVWLLDSAKIGVRSVKGVVPLRDVDVMICETKRDAKVTRPLRDAGLTIEYATAPRKQRG